MNVPDPEGLKAALPTIDVQRSHRPIPSPQLRRRPNPFFSWMKRLKRFTPKQVRQEQEAVDHSRTIGKKFASVSRQQRRATEFAVAWKTLCQSMGGGAFWTGKDLEPRRARRRIARVWAKKGIPEA